MQTSMQQRRGGLFQEGIWALRDAGIDNPVLDAAVLLAHVTGEPAETVLMDRSLLVTPSQQRLYASLIKKRCERTAVSRLLGEREFYSRSFYVTDDVLDPRPETEILIDEIIECFPDPGKDLHIMDVGTGSGAIAVTVAAQIPGARVTATDISAGALRVAKQNAERHNVQNQITFLQADLTEGIRGRGVFQAILSNPPYVSVQEYENLQHEVLKGDPVSALVGGPEGTEFYPPLAIGAMRLLDEGGLLIVETGGGQADTVAGIFEKAGLADVRIIEDLSGAGRVVRGKKENA